MRAILLWAGYSSAVCLAALFNDHITGMAVCILLVMGIIGLVYYVIRNIK